MDWWWILLILLVVILLLWWALRKNAKETEAPTQHEDENLKSKAVESVQKEPVVETAMAVETRAAEVAKQAVEDDLELIEGIGPKISSILKEAGISTFAQLSKEEPGNLKSILEKAGLRLGDPTTWPMQAKLAAEGNLEALQKLQDQLKGGRLVK